MKGAFDDEELFLLVWRRQALMKTKTAFLLDPLFILTHFSALLLFTQLLWSHLEISAFSLALVACFSLQICFGLFQNLES